MDINQLADDARVQLRERPYWTLAATVGIGWILGRSVPLRALVAVASIGARAAVANALEDVVLDRVRPRPRRNASRNPEKEYTT